MVSDFALQADICHKAMACFRIDAGCVARVWIAVGIAVSTSKSKNKFITVSYSGHGFISPRFFWCKNLSSVDNSRS